MDALIRIIEEADEPPVCGVPDGLQTCTAGIPLSIDIVASDPDGMITGIEAVNMPHWAKLSIITKLPAADVVACISGLPKPEDTGLHTMSIAVTDNDGNRVHSSLMIEVVGFTGGQPGVF